MNKPLVLLNRGFLGNGPRTFFYMVAMNYIF